MLFVRDDISSVTTPVMRLRHFTRIKDVEPGATRDVRFRLDARKDLWLVDGDLKKVVEPGTFTLFLGGASDKIQQTASLRVADPARSGL